MFCSTTYYINLSIPISSNISLHSRINIWERKSGRWTSAVCSCYGLSLWCAASELNWGGSRFTINVLRTEQRVISRVSCSFNSKKTSLALLVFTFTANSLEKSRRSRRERIMQATGQMQFPRFTNVHSPNSFSSSSVDHHLKSNPHPAIADK